MKEYRALLRSPAYRSYWIALLGSDFGSWCVIAALPVLIANRFGTGMVLVLSLGLRVIPKIVLAPLAGHLLRRFGPARLASSSIVVMAALTALLPWCREQETMQAVIAGIGTLDLFITPGLLSLRGAVTPPGLSMPSNTMFSVADRVAKVSGPALGGLFVMAGFKPAFAAFAVMTALAALPIMRLNNPIEPAAARDSRLRDVVPIIRSDPQILGIIITALTYTVLLGGLRPFLFWANRDWFGGSDAAWTGLLAAQGAGALVGAIGSAMYVGRMTRGMTAYTLMLVTGLMESMIHFLLLTVYTSTQAILILALAGIPEIVSTAAWFTVLQERLSPTRQGVLFTFLAPCWDVFFALGVVSAGLHANGLLSLSAYWTLICLVAILPLFPLLLLKWRTRRPE